MEKKSEKREFSAPNRKKIDSIQDGARLSTFVTIWARKTVAYTFILLFSMCLGFFGSWAMQKIRYYYGKRLNPLVSLADNSINPKD